MKKKYRVSIFDSVITVYAHSMRQAHERAMAYLQECGIDDPERCCIGDDYIDYDECMEEYYDDDNELEIYFGENARFL